MRFKNILISGFSVATAVAVAVLLVSYPPLTAKSNATKKTKSVTYPGFGIWLPPDYEVHGIDVSRHQGKIDWDEVSAHKHNDVQIAFTFIKASEGITIKDNCFSANWSKAKNANLLRGAYHFYRSHLTPQQQFNLFKSQVKLTKEDLPPVLDVEVRGSCSPAKFKRDVKTWLVLAEKHYGVIPILYINYSFYKNYFRGPEFKKYPMWIAHYATEDLNRLTTNWNFWQHNESGRVKGIKGGVDFNVFNGPYEDLLKLCKK